MKKTLLILPILLIGSLFSTSIMRNDKASEPIKAEAATNGYRVRISIAVTDDADYWEEACYCIFVKSDHGRGDQRALGWSENFYNSISYSGAVYNSSETYTGTDFPSYIGIYTGLGAFWQYHYGESDVKVYINGINVASQHIHYGGWNYTTDYNTIAIDQSKFPRPDEKKINLEYSENVDPSEESTQIVRISAVDQYNVKWTTPASSPISLVNESYPENDTAQRMDDCGFIWKLNSNLDVNHYSTYTIKFSTASSVYPIVEKKFKVQFAFPLHLSIMVNNEIVYKVSGYAGDVIKIPDNLPTPTGYYIYNYKKTGMGTIEQDKETKAFSFTFVAGDTVLTASVKPITYKITFDKNGENVTGTLLDKTVTYNAKNVYLPLNRYAREGYKFIGWNTEKDGSGTSFTDKALVPNLTTKKGEIVTLYAQWESTNPSVTASLFTDGSFGLIIGGVTAGLAVIGLATFLVYKSKKREE